VSSVDIEENVDRKETLASIVYDRLRKDIISVVVPPGEKLHIRSLCERFEVGLSPVREALSRLSTEGLVAQNDHRGFAVAPISEADLLDLTRARSWLNDIAIRKSIERGDAAWEETVVLSFHRLFRTPRFAPGVETERSEAWEIAHRNFHTSLISASGSDRLTHYCEQLFDSAERYRHVGRKAGVKGNRDKEHRQLMEAVVARDAETAARVITRHFERTAELVREVLRGHPS
jgi:GntR family transcriptional regulator, carbon starvation induced regulator